MNEPLSPEAMLAGTIAGGATVLAGAGYALFFAIGRLTGRQRYTALALASYVALTVAVAVLVRSLRLEGLWTWLALTLLLGYFTAPRMIWKLCVGTHGEPQPAQPARDLQ